MELKTWSTCRTKKGVLVPPPRTKLVHGPRPQTKILETSVETES